MRKIKPTTQVPSLFLSRIGEGLRDGRIHKNRTNYTAVKDVLKNCMREYNKNLVPINLESLMPYGGFTEEQKQTVKNLYESGASEFDLLWDELKELNGGTRLRCPICGVTFANELDHYVPREKFPEFSANPLNIIPLCHDCNHTKLAKWKDTNGFRMIFNAYFDELPQQKILSCSISRIVNDFPLAEVSFCNLNNPIDADIRAKKTIGELELIDFYNDVVNKDLGTTIAHIQDEYSMQQGRYNDSAAFWNDRKMIFATYLNNPQKYTEEQLLLYEALTNSPVFDAWIVLNI